jgi:preprotein translocase subunit YajC
MNLMLLLAQPTSAPAGPPMSGMEMFWRQLFPIILVVGVFWWFMSRGRSKERRRYEDMLKALKKNDRVQTIGGVLGTVVDVRDNEVVLKIDETSNVKMRFNRTAIKEVLQEADVESKS